MLQHAGLDDAQLGPRLARLLAANSPLPAREMVARGLAPLAGSEGWLALYQLWVRGGPTLAEHAGRTAGELPPAAVMTALADPHLPPVVLDFMARRRIRSPETLRLIVHHPRVHDATLAALARCAPELVCSAIARNQRRWLACPAIAEQLVHNPCCERATAHAVLELGAREAIAVLVELRRRALAGVDLQDSPATHARATAWMLRSGPAEPFPELTGPSLGPAASARPEAARSPRAADRDGLGAPARPQPAPRGSSDDLSLQAGPFGELSLQPGVAAPLRGVDLIARSSEPLASELSPAPGMVAPAVRGDLSPRPGPESAAANDRGAGLAGRLGVPSDELDELDELDLPIGEDWDEDPAEVDVLAPREAVPLPELELPPPAATRAQARGPGTAVVQIWSSAGGQLELPGPAATRERERPPLPGYRESLAQVLDPGTPLPLAMSLLHRLRAPDLRRVAAARRLAPALIAAARRRTGAA